MNVAPFLAHRRGARRRHALALRARPRSADRDPHALAADEARRAANYPISRFCWRPLAARLAAWLAERGVAPLTLTLANLAFGLLACLTLVAFPTAFVPAAGLFLLAWICDRTDGQLARRLNVSSRAGAWLDANVDELIDLAGKSAAAYATAAHFATVTPWLALSLFTAGKYLAMHGLLTAVSETPRRVVAARDSSPATETHDANRAASRRASSLFAWLDALRRAPANADVRLHAFLVALVAAAWFPAALPIEAAAFGAYYLLWAVARLAITPTRLGSATDG